MKTFERSRTTNEIVLACRDKGYRVSTERYDQGSDYINFDFPYGGDIFRVVFNGFNGRFFGTSARGVKFNSDTDEHGKKPWFNALLSFIYVGENEE